MTFQTKITVEGVDISSYVINYKVIDTVEDITPANLSLNRTINTIIDLQKDQEVIITRGTVTSTDNTIFRGNISFISKNKGETTEIEALDKLWLLSRQTITISYDQDTDAEAGIISAIASDLIIRGGLTPDVETSSTATKIDKYIIRSNNILEKLQELAKLIDYWLYYDPSTNTVNFKSKGFTSFSTTLQVGVNLVEVPKWDYDYNKIINDVTITGDLQEIETTEEVAGGVTSTTLTQKPESVKVFIENPKNTSTLQVGGVTEQSGTFAYTVDKENSKINFVTLTSGTAEIRYSYLIPIKVRKKNPDSIGKYGTHAISKKNDTIQTSDDAELKANEVLGKFPNPIVSTENLKIFNVFGGRAGQEVQVIDSVGDENRLVNIRRYTYNHPIHIDELEVNDEPIYEDYILLNAIRQRIERLERKNESAGTLITQLIAFDRTFQPRRRFSKIQSQTASGTGFILGDLNFGVLGTNSLGTPFHEPATTLKLVQGDMTYYEDLRDNTFLDSGSTDAVVTSTGTNPSVAMIEFSSGSVYQTSAIDLGTTLTSHRLDSGSASGSFKYEISNDGKNNWQQFSTGAVVNTTNTGTSTYLRITEDAGASGTIRNVVNDYGQVTSPALKLILNEG